MNMRSNTCPCCGDSLLRHVRHGELYWFCQTCRQEVPLLSANIQSSLKCGGKESGC
jgi:ribosomal protein L37AE/L43A